MNQLTISFQHLEKPFRELLSEESTVKFAQECIYARQIVEKNKDLMRILKDNPQSIENAIIASASTDITLNPNLSKKMSYLIPRGDEATLYISYQGLYSSACKSGSIMSLQTRVFRKNDIIKPPTNLYAPIYHEYNPLKDRGEIAGVFCTAMISENSFMTELMDMKEIAKVQNCSKMRYGPWKDWFEAMMRKSAIRKASSSWTHKEGHFANVITHLDETEGIDFEQVKKEVNQIDYSKDNEEKDKIIKFIKFHWWGLPHSAWEKKKLMSDTCKRLFNKDVELIPMKKFSVDELKILSDEILEVVKPFKE